MENNCNNRDRKLKCGYSFLPVGMACRDKADRAVAPGIHRISVCGWVSDFKMDIERQLWVGRWLHPIKKFYGSWSSARHCLSFLKIKIKTCYVQRLLRINFTKSRSWTSPSPTPVSSSYETQECLMFKLKGMGWSFLSWLYDSFLCIFLVSRFLKINIIAFLGNPPTLFSQRV